MLTPEEIDAFKEKAHLSGRYQTQLLRLQNNGIPTISIEKAVMAASEKVASGNRALVIYGEPQSGKTEMMICLTAKLLDEGRHIIVHLMNDSVDLLTQNLRRFKGSGLAPAAKNSSELQKSFVLQPSQELVVFCKKNGNDLAKLIERLKGQGDVVVVDDEADYATPNSKVNVGAKTPINSLIETLIGPNGVYIGVTATPARLDLNGTFNNSAEQWVSFPPHEKYTGQDVFFPLKAEDFPYRLTLLDDNFDVDAPRKALVRFLVTSAYLNTEKNQKEENYTLLVHTSGKKIDHEADRLAIEQAVQSLSDVNNAGFNSLLELVFVAAKELYPSASPHALTEYVVKNASRVALVVLNSERDRTAAGESATDPTSPFTVIIGGNIVSRGVTFPNLLAMYFTRNVAQKLQQDTYIQRARMFGARGSYLPHFELSIPESLYSDWHRCFVFHRLALSTVQAGLGSPVWISDKRVSVAASASINKATVQLDRGEMSFAIFDFVPELDELAVSGPNSIDTLKKMREIVGDASLPGFLIQYIEAVDKNKDSLGIHTSSPLSAAYSSADAKTISRDKGLMGNPQMETGKPQFANALHHIKIFRNDAGKARVFYKYRGSVQFVKNLKKTLAAP